MFVAIFIGAAIINQSSFTQFSQFLWVSTFLSRVLQPNNKQTILDGYKIELPIYQ